MATCLPCGRRATIKPGLARRVKMGNGWIILRRVDCPVCGSLWQEIHDGGPCAARHVAPEPKEGPCPARSIPR